MKSLWYAIKSEVVKLRHTPIFLLHIIVPLLGGLLFAMYHYNICVIVGVLYMV